MRFLTKSFTAVLIFSLLAQNVAAVPAAKSRKNRPSLQAVQQQALKDKAWLEEHALPVATGVSITSLFAASYLAIDNVRKSRKAKFLEKDLKRALTKQQQLRKENRLLQEDNDVLVEAVYNQHQQIKEGELQLEKARQQNAYLQNKANGLKRGYEKQIVKRQELQASLTATEKQTIEIQNMFMDEIDLLNKQIFSAKAYINVSNSLSREEMAQLEKYAEMFNGSLPLEERLAVRKSLLQDPFFKSFSAEEKEGLLSIIDRFIELAGYPISKEAEMYALAYQTGQFLSQHATPASRFLRGLGNQIIKKNNLISAVLILVFVAAPALNSHAQSSDWARRIDTNFDLFLNATPQQLAEMEKHRDVYEACVRGAAIQNFLTTLSEEEQAEYKKSFEVSSPRQQLKNRNLAY